MKLGKHVLGSMFVLLVLAPPVWAGWYLMIPPPPADFGQSGKWEALGEPVSTRWWIERSFDTAEDCEAERSRDVAFAKSRLQAWRKRSPQKEPASGEDRKVPVELIVELQRAGALCIATNDPRLV